MNGVSSDKSVNLGEIFICGFICCIGLFEAAHLMGIFMQRTISFCGWIFAAGFLALMIVGILGFAAAVRREKLTMDISRDKAIQWGSFPAAVVFLGLAASQVLYICTVPLYQTPGDIMLETVNSFLVTDGIYTVSPLTGKPFGGPPFRYKILCLPTAYSMLCRWFPGETETLIARVIPLITLFTSYTAYYLLSGSLLGRGKTGLQKRIWFLVVIGILFYFCENAVYLEGYGILHGGYQGTAIRNSILVPFVLYAALEKKWLQAILCVLAEACIVWTFWGLGVCAVVLTGMVLLPGGVELLQRKGLLSGLRKKEGNDL